MVCYLRISDKNLKERFLKYLEDLEFGYYECSYNEGFSCNHRKVMKSDNILSIDTELKIIKTTSTYTAKDNIMSLNLFMDVLKGKVVRKERETVYVPVSNGTIRKGEIVKQQDDCYIIRFCDGGMGRLKKNKVYGSIIEAERYAI